MYCILDNAVKNIRTAFL